MLRRRGQKGSNIGWILLLVLLLAGGAAAGFYVYTAEDFERTPPVIEVAKEDYWNAKDPIEIKISDNFGLKSYQIALNDGKNEVIAEVADGLGGMKEKSVPVKFSSGKLDSNAKTVTLKIQAVDGSKWNLFAGNKSEKTVTLKIDYRRPNANVVASSYSITQGGSALVIFQASDDDALAKLYVQSGKNRFKAQPYKKEGYFAALIAWPFVEENFEAKVVAEDKAGNIRMVEVPFYLKNANYQTSKIEATDKFIDGKITDLAEHDPKYMKSDRLQRFKSVNETMRIDNENLIHALSSKVSDEMIEEWKIVRFDPLKNGQRVASFGDHRYYYYANDKNNIVTQSYHVGYDTASTQMAPILASNRGKVVFADYNGIYGNMPMIDHGMGLFSLYGHCSTLLVKEGDSVETGQEIAKTGMTGLAMGDHLHFGILVQGIEVRPVEWLDPKWLRDNVEKIFRDADKVIVGVGDSNKSMEVKSLN